MARARRQKKKLNESSCVKKGNVWVKSTKRTPHCRKYVRSTKPRAPRKPRQKSTQSTPQPTQQKQSKSVVDCPAQQFNKSMNRKDLENVCKNGRIIRQAALLLHPDKNSGCSALATQLFQRLGDTCSKL
jgi:hypothetical protein